MSKTDHDRFGNPVGTAGAPTRPARSEAPLPHDIASIQLVDDRGNKRPMQDMSGAEIARAGERIGAPVDHHNGREVNARIVAKHLSEAAA